MIETATSPTAPGRHDPSGIRGYDRTRWGGAPPRTSHVVRNRLGISFLLQHGEGIPDGMTIESGPEPTLRLLVRLSPSPRVQATVGGLRFSGVQEAGAYVLIPPGQPARFVTDAATFDMTAQVHVDPLVLRSVARGLEVDGPPALHPAFGSRDPLVAAATESLLEQAGDPASEPTAWLTAAESLVMRLFTLHGGRLPDAPARGGLAPWQLRRVRDLMADRLSEPITLADLAAAARISPFHFCRAFRETVGEPPLAHLARLRLERAMVLLRETDRPVAAIALDVGYLTESGLSRLFRRHLGMAPATYRAQARR